MVKLFKNINLLQFILLITVFGAIVEIPIYLKNGDKTIGFAMSAIVFSAIFLALGYLLFYKRKPHG